MNTRFLKSIKKEWTEAIKNEKVFYKCITANTSAICRYGSMLHIPPINLILAAEQEPYKKACLVTKIIGRIFWKKFRRMDQQSEKKR